MCFLQLMFSLLTHAEFSLKPSKANTLKLDMCVSLFIMTFAPNALIKLHYQITYLLGVIPLPKLNAALRKSCVKAGFSAAFLKKLRKSCVFSDLR